ncbi:hypothetical protein V8C43DRAFT_285874 [Trichoderma afarasin]
MAGTKDAVGSLASTSARARDGSFRGEEAGLGSTVILLHVPFSHQAPIPSVFCRQRVRTHSGPPLRMSCCICRPPFCSRGIRNPLGASVSSSKQAVELHQDHHVPTAGGPTTAACRIRWFAVISAAISSTRVPGRRICLTRVRLAAYVQYPPAMKSMVWSNGSGCTHTVLHCTVSAPVLFVYTQRGSNTAGVDTIQVRRVR